MNRSVSALDRANRNCVLVTGSNGFVGRALCQELAVRGMNFVPVVRRANGMALASVIVGDIGADTDWSAALSGVDAVVHLASRVHVMRERANDPLSAFRRVNTEGTLNLARQAVASGVRRFIFISTIKVNGEGGQQPYTEDDQPAPEGAYALSKWEAECGLREIAENSSMEVVILRPPLVYGPGVSANFLRMMQVINLGLPLPFGRIFNCRSLVFLGNLVDLVIRCMTHPMAANRTFLVSDGDDLSTSELLRRLGEMLRKPVKQIPFPTRLLKFGFGVLGKPAVAQRLLGSLQVDISRARELLEWTPPVQVDEGLRRTVEHFLGSLQVR